MQYDAKYTALLQIHKYRVEPRCHPKTTTLYVKLSLWQTTQKNQSVLKYITRYMGIVHNIGQNK